MVFDYVDKAEPYVEAQYVRHAASVVAISPELAEAGRAYGKPVTLIPNGVDADRYTRVSRQEAKARLGLEGRPVVSLIGLTCSHDLYFVDAVAQLQRQRPDVALLIVGGGKVREAIVAKAGRCGIKNLHAPGSIPFPQVPLYFRASDVGLYPGEDTRYYREASPLKVVEYVAAGARVVSSPVNLFRAGWPAVALTDPNADAFADAIRAGLDAPVAGPDAPSLNDHDWAALADRFEQCLRRAAVGDEAGCADQKS
jgi:glycosyltransferase involved in cell wall biosynthesis